MSEERAIWGIHLEWDKGLASGEPEDIAIGGGELGDLKRLAANRDAFKAAFSKAFPEKTVPAVRTGAGMLFRFATEMRIGDVVVYPAKADRMVKIGVIAGEYRFAPEVDPVYPHRRKVTWKISLPRASFSQAALYEIGSAMTMFKVSGNAEEFLAALEGKPPEASEVDTASEQLVAEQVDENVEDFVMKRLISGLSHEQFEHFVAELLRCMGYHARVTRFSGDGGVDVIAHKDELGFEPPIIKVQCKHTLNTISGPAVQNLLGAIQPGESALFVTMGGYSADARHIERNNGRLRLLGQEDLLALIFAHYERLDPRYKSLIPLKRSYSPSVGRE